MLNLKSRPFKCLLKNWFCKIWYFTICICFNQLKGQQTSWKLNDVLTLDERNVNGWNFIVPLFANAQWSSLVLEGHFWILINLFKSRVCCSYNRHQDISKCMLSFKSGFEMIQVQNGHFGSKILKFHYIKSPIFWTFLDANGQCPVVYLLKKITQNFSVVVSCC
jgi:hypothetical protein